MKRILAIFVAAILTLGVSSVVASSAHADLRSEVYYVYNSDCGGSNPWHDTGFYWWCVNRNVELQTISHNSNYTEGVVTYCYTEAKIGAKKERCMEVRTTPWGIENMLAYWTNSG